ncbi:serine/threonine-protein kinase tel1 [Teratosphaeria destructans]|uniref:Serine/threonine-protein kinase Tel1 n=1 Tax=Teratosphaeria destructans TaxID=418781 RepID=A0A9W7SUM3_9PEZI|nr:serine/threonine-protein kinase tel1 [Teratosphaeria destructans]
MAAEVTLKDALDGIKSSRLGDRSKGLEYLRNIFRHQQGKTTVLENASYATILKVLFDVIVAEQKTWAASSKSVSRSASETRLVNASSALRSTVESGTKCLKLKTVRAVVTHVLDAMRIANGTLCYPIAVDYARCLRVVLSYQAHVEHLAQSEWEWIARACVQLIQEYQDEFHSNDASGDTNLRSTAVASTGMSYRSSRSHYQESAQSQGEKSIWKSVLDEVLAAVAALCASPNAPVTLGTNAKRLLWAVIDYLKFGGRARQHAFEAINSILIRTRIESIDLTQQATGHLLRLIRNLWTEKSPKDHMLVTLLYLRPYMTRVMQQDDGQTLRSELSNLSDVMRADYSRKSDKDLLRLDDLRLSTPAQDGTPESAIQCSIFSLQCLASGAEPSAELRVERAWTMLSILAFMLKLTMSEAHGSSASETDGDGDDRGVDEQGPRKRRRVANGFDDLVGAIATSSPGERICAIQTAAFLTQEQRLTSRNLTRLMDRLLASCSEDNFAVNSWALVGLTGCASQLTGTHASLADRWLTAWSLAKRATSNPATCRAASHLLALLAVLNLVPQATISELSQPIIGSSEMSGPAVLADSTLNLLRIFLRSAQQLNPHGANSLSEAVLGWFGRTFVPSKVDDRNFAAAYHLYSVRDVVVLLNTCANHVPQPIPSRPLPLWGAIGQAWVTCKQQEELSKYLLLLPTEADRLRQELNQTTSSTAPSSFTPRWTCESLILDHFTSELQALISNWHRQFQEVSHMYAISKDMFGSLCTTVCISAAVAHGHNFKDDRRQTHVQGLLHKLLEYIRDYATRQICERDKIEILLLCSSQMLGGLHIDGSEQYEASSYEQVLCRHISKVLSARRRLADLNEHDQDDDLMDLSEDFDSQDSRMTKVATPPNGLANTQSALFGAAALQAMIDVYATAVQQLLADGPHDDLCSGHVIDHILGFPAEDLILCYPMLAKLSMLKICLNASDAYKLMDHIAAEDGILNLYVYERSEVALGAVLDIAASLTQLWTSVDDQELHDLGLDYYDFFMRSLKKGALAPDIQRRLASMLLKICHIDTEYGGNTSFGSARSTLFKLLNDATVVTLYSLSTQIPGIFGQYVLELHEELFDDLQRNLPDDEGWVEGLAMRLLFLGQIACAWHTVRPQCVYYIFESAGRVKRSEPYAAQCVKDLSADLQFETGRRLFELFAPQLIFTWLEQHTVIDLPFVAFGYESLNELLERNQAEVTAQVILRGKQDAIHVLSTALGLTNEGLAKGAFAKCLAYTMSEDVRLASIAKSKDQQPATHESRLRELVGGKHQLSALAVAHFPTIVGQFFLSMAGDDDEEKWLGRHAEYSSACAAVKEVKRISHSCRAVAKTQEPSFKGTLIPDQLARLCRRVGHNQFQLWSASTFALTARVLLDAISDALGPLHTCLILRKLRTLICMAGDFALHGFAAEMLVHSLRPLVRDTECADDALGILQYLLNASQQYFKIDGLTFVSGEICLMVLQMHEHCDTVQEITTQGSQHRATVPKMAAFQTWLVAYLERCSPKDRDFQRKLARYLGGVRLPWNARKGSQESGLLLLLLDQFIGENMLYEQHADEALELLATRFKAPSTLYEDCLSRDDMAAHYSESLWRLITRSHSSEAFLSWAAKVVGRAYAATGSRPHQLNSNQHDPPAETDRDAVRSSQRRITNRLVDLVLSSSRSNAGLADWTLREVMSICASTGSADAALEFKNLLPTVLVDVVDEGSFGYIPSLAVKHAGPDPDHRRLKSALDVKPGLSDRDWAIEVAVALCQWTYPIPLLVALPSILQSIEGLAIELLPWIMHIVLWHEVDDEPIVQSRLSSAMMAHFASKDESLLSRQRLLIKWLLYVRAQKRPGEKTMVDRLKWLEIDAMASAEAAARCGLPTAALLLAESIPPVQATHTNRRASGRASMVPLASVQIPESLLLSVFKQIEEPDSYYGVPQPPSLTAVLERLDYEGDGFKSLMFRSAQLDTQMRTAHRPSLTDSSGLMRSLSSLNMHSFEYALLSGPMNGSAQTGEDMLEAARKLQQWDIAPPEVVDGSPASTFAALRGLSRASQRQPAADRLRSLLFRLVSGGSHNNAGSLPTLGWCAALAVLTEINDVVDSTSEEAYCLLWDNMQNRVAWMETARYEDVQSIISARSTLFSVLAQNTSLLRDMHVGAKTARSLEAKSLLAVAHFARQHGAMQESLSAVTQLGHLTSQAQAGLRVDVATTSETATTLWESGEVATSVKMLQEVVRGVVDYSKQDIQVGRSGLLAQLGHQLAEARLGKPEDILDDCLKPAITHLRGKTKGDEAGKVFYEFAAFCDQQLQNPSSVEDFNRAFKLRERRLRDVQELNAMTRDAKKSSKERHDAANVLRKMQSYFEIDNAEYQRLKESRDSFTVQSLQNYLLALHASNEHDITVLRFFALWLDNAASPGANAVVSQHLPNVPSWKFAVLNNQLMSRLENENSVFQCSLKAVVQRICSEHPYQSLHQLFATTRPVNNADEAAQSRYQAASTIRQTVQASGRSKEVLNKWFQANHCYVGVAQEDLEQRSDTKSRISSHPPIKKRLAKVEELKVPPATVNVPLRPDGDYANVPILEKWEDVFSIMGGLSKPKAMTASASDGQRYKQLLKSGDDLRQDAIMEQVFEEVSHMLRKHKTTRQRDLHVRTYKVIPLTNKTGILEFVPNSIPIGDYLKPAHGKYYTKSVKHGDAHKKIRDVDKLDTDTRIKEFRKICDQMPPVMRYFFFENYKDPDEWFEKRTAYTRTTAAISILGHVLGLGDRHCQNILLDEKSGEVVHIDLGVAFEAGRVLPIPETVPFRLSRDIVDGMGATKVEGIFRRCCEFTMDALREDKDSIMTLLNVLRYDPLYSWTLSPLRAKRIQDAQETGMGEVGSGKRSQQEAGEADRALSIVEKKLSKTLSTAATVNELIQVATDEKNLALLFAGWCAFY